MQDLLDTKRYLVGYERHGDQFQAVAYELKIKDLMILKDLVQTDSEKETDLYLIGDYEIDVKKTAIWERMVGKKLDWDSHTYWVICRKKY